MSSKVQPRPVWGSVISLPAAVLFHCVLLQSGGGRTWSHALAQVSLHHGCSSGWNWGMSLLFSACGWQGGQSPSSLGQAFGSCPAAPVLLGLPQEIGVRGEEGSQPPEPEESVVGVAGFGDAYARCRAQGKVD